MKKTTSVKSTFAKKRANAKNPPVKPVKASDRDTKNPTPEPAPAPPPPPSSEAAEVINGPAPVARPCGPAITQAGHHEVVQS